MLQERMDLTVTRGNYDVIDHASAHQKSGCSLTAPYSKMARDGRAARDGEGGGEEMVEKGRVDGGRAGESLRTREETGDGLVRTPANVLTAAGHAASEGGEVEGTRCEPPPPPPPQTTPCPR